MPKTDLRNDTRNPCVGELEYSITFIDYKKSQHIEDIAVCVDISNKGIGILINHPLRAGHVVDLKNNEKAGVFSARKAEVKWAERINDTIYRAGLKFA